MAELGFFKEIFHHEIIVDVFVGIYVIFADQSFDFAVFKAILDQTIEVNNFQVKFALTAPSSFDFFAEISLPSVKNTSPLLWLEFFIKACFAKEHPFPWFDWKVLLGRHQQA